MKDQQRVMLNGRRLIFQLCALQWQFVEPSWEPLEPFKLVALSGRRLKGPMLMMFNVCMVLHKN